MLFNDKLLNKVQMFSSEEWLNANSRDAPHDEITVIFEGQKSFLGYKYHGTWTKVYSFKYKYTGTKDNTRMFSANPDVKELTNQLSEHLSGQRIEISKENYDFFKDLYPDRFI